MAVKVHETGYGKWKVPVIIIAVIVVLGLAGTGILLSAITKHISHCVKTYRILQICLRNILRTQRISRHQNLLCNIICRKSFC